MATAAQRRQFHERIEVLCAAGTDAMTFREAVLRELRRTIGFDAHVWLLTDPATTVGAAPHARVPAFEHLPSLIKYKYLTPVNRWTELAARGIQVSSLVRATDGDPSRSLVWRKILAGHSVSDVASAVMVDRAGCWGFLDLWRSGRSEPFDDGEAIRRRRAFVARRGDPHAYPGAAETSGSDVYRNSASAVWSGRTGRAPAK
ncbi:hypothetical protein [Arthrobacter pigmenti]